jgi:hypothetical protein
MAQIYDELSCRHLRRGWPVYWRINLPFCVHLAYLGAALAFVFSYESDLVDYYVARFAPSLVDRPEIPNTLIAAVLYLLGLPLVRRGNAWLSRRFECSFYRSQFALLAPLEKFNRGLFCLYGAFLILLFVQWDHFRSDLRHLWIWLLLLAAVFLAVVTVSVFYYGWLDGQFKDDGKDPTP